MTAARMIAVQQRVVVRGQASEIRDLGLRVGGKYSFADETGAPGIWQVVSISEAACLDASVKYSSRDRRHYTIDVVVHPVDDDAQHHIYSVPDECDITA